MSPPVAAAGMTRAGPAPHSSALAVVRQFPALVREFLDGGVRFGGTGVEDEPAIETVLQLDGDITTTIFAPLAGRMTTDRAAALAEIEGHYAALDVHLAPLVRAAGWLDAVGRVPRWLPASGTVALVAGGGGLVADEAAIAAALGFEFAPLAIATAIGGALTLVGAGVGWAAPRVLRWWVRRQFG